MNCTKATKTIFGISSVLLLALLTCSKSITEQDDLLTISQHKGLFGKLVDYKGMIVSGVRVKAVGASTSTAIDSTLTDSTGYFSFLQLSAGYYNLQGDYNN
jgi:hypothetical protein